MNKLFTFILISILFFSFAKAINAQEEITLTTYYPSPYGIYQELRSDIYYDTDDSPPLDYWIDMVDNSSGSEVGQDSVLYGLHLKEDLDFDPIAGNVHYIRDTQHNGIKFDANGITVMPEWNTLKLGAEDFVPGSPTANLVDIYSFNGIKFFIVGAMDKPGGEVLGINAIGDVTINDILVATGPPIATLGGDLTLTDGNLILRSDFPSIDDGGVIFYDSDGDFLPNDDNFIDMYDVDGNEYSMQLAGNILVGEGNHSWISNTGAIVDGDGIGVWAGTSKRDELDQSFSLYANTKNYGVFAVTQDERPDHDDVAIWGVNPAKASPAGNNGWAGRFRGNVLIEGNLIVQKDPDVDPSVTTTGKIYMLVDGDHPEPGINNGTEVFKLPSSIVVVHDPVAIDDLSEAVKAIDCEPADIVVIDSENALQFVKSSEAYATNIAGVISSRPGLYLGDKKDKLPLALAGLVPTKVVSENGPIKSGDLLVSSSKPGYAMRGDIERIKPGMVIGKALESLEEEEGKIVVLVNVN